MTTRFAHYNSITIAANRQRQEFNETELTALGDSIEKYGLLQAPVFRVIGDSYELVAGERRLRAITDLYSLGRSFTYSGERVPSGMIPFTLISDLSPLALKEVELEENIRRVDLTWQERAMATAELAQLRRDQALEKGLPPPTTAAISLEVRGSSEGINQETTRKELILAKHLDDPEVKAAKTPQEAFKLLKKREEVARNTELAATVGKTYTASIHTCKNVDASVWLQGHMSESFDVILTDPPYGMGADEFGDSGTGGSAGAHFYPDSSGVVQKILGWFPRESYRVAKAEAHVYVFCDIDWFPEWKTEMASAGWRVFRTPLIWYKPSGFRAPWPEHGPQRKYECILYAVKGNKKTLKLGSDVLQIPVDESLGHPAQKPVALYEELLRRSCRAGDKVADFFCGSGPIFEAAHNLRLTATGLEMDPAAYGIAVKRLQRLTSEPELPI